MVQEWLTDEGKIDKVVDELNRYQVSAAVLQETKWFGDETYKVARKGFVFTSGRQMPHESIVLYYVS